VYGSGAGYRTRFATALIAIAMMVVIGLIFLKCAGLASAQTPGAGIETLKD
jgi:hypothetical protein